MELKHFPDNAKVWIYQANRLLNETEVNWLNEQIQAFTKDWAAHGTQLRAEGKVLKNAAILLAVDQDIHEASGCSIDTSVRFIKQMGKELEVDFFNRLKVLIHTENQTFDFVSYSKLKDTPHKAVLDVTVQSWGEIDPFWLN